MRVICRRILIQRKRFAGIVLQIVFFSTVFVENTCIGQGRLLNLLTQNEIHILRERPTYYELLNIHYEPNTVRRIGDARAFNRL